MQASLVLLYASSSIATQDPLEVAQDLSHHAAVKPKTVIERRAVPERIGPAGIHTAMTTSCRSFLDRTGVKDTGMSYATSRDTKGFSGELILKIEQDARDAARLKPPEIARAAEFGWMSKTVQPSGPRKCTIILSATEDQVRAMRMRKTRAKRRSPVCESEEERPKKRRRGKPLLRGGFEALRDIEVLRAKVRLRMLLCCLSFFVFKSPDQKQAVVEGLRAQVEVLSRYIARLNAAFDYDRRYRIVSLTEEQTLSYIIAWATRNHTDDDVGAFIHRVIQRHERGKFTNAAFMGVFDKLRDEMTELFIENLKLFHADPARQRVLRKHGLGLIDINPSQTAHSDVAIHRPEDDLDGDDL